MTAVALIGCGIAILAWGSAGIFDKLAMRDIDPFSGVLVRMVFITASVLVFCAATGRLRPVLEFSGRTYLYLIISGVLGGLVGQLAYYVAIKHAPVTQVVPITATYPAIAFMLAVLFLREQPTLPKVGGMLMVIAGLILISGAQGKSSPDENRPPPALNQPAPSQSQASSPPARPVAQDRDGAP